MKKLFFLMFLSSIFLLSCSSGDSKKEECRIDLVNAIENENFEEALSILEEDDCQFSREEKIINTALIHNLTAGVDFLKISEYLSQIIADEDKFRKVSVFVSSNASSINLQNIEHAIDVYSQIDPEDEIATYCYTYRKDLSQDQQDICFYAGLSYLSKSIYVLYMGLANLGESYAKQVANRFLLQIRRETFCTEDRNKNHIIDEVDAFLCAVEYANGNNCDIDDVLLSAKRITIDYKGDSYDFSLLKIKIKNDEDKCPSYEDRIIYKLYSYDIDAVVLTEGYCKQDYSQCSEPDDTECFPCPVFINDQLLPVVDTVVNSLNNSYRSIWSSFNAPEDVSIARTFKDFLNEICSPDPEDCICGRTDECTEEDLEYYVVPIAITEDALINYLKTYYQEEED